MKNQNVEQLRPEFLLFVDKSLPEEYDQNQIEDEMAIFLLFDDTTLTFQRRSFVDHPNLIVELLHYKTEGR